MKQISFLRAFALILYLATKTIQVSGSEDERLDMIINWLVGETGTHDLLSPKDCVNGIHTVEFSENVSAGQVITNLGAGSLCSRIQFYYPLFPYPIGLPYPMLDPSSFPPSAVKIKGDLEDAVKLDNNWDVVSTRSLDRETICPDNSNSICEVKFLFFYEGKEDKPTTLRLRISDKNENSATFAKDDLTKIEVLSIDHKIGQDGQYFNFNSSTIDPNCFYQLFNVTNERNNRVDTVTIWNGTNGGSAGWGHGRKEPKSAAAKGDWETGDVLRANCYPVHLINPTGKQADDARHESTTIDKAFDGQQSSCYVSEFFDAIAKINVNMSKVTQIRLLNRKSTYWADRMKGIKVSVCSGDTECSKCGILGNTAASQWGEVKCANGGVTGDVIKLTRQGNILQFCEMEIMGFGNSGSE